MKDDLKTAHLEILIRTYKFQIREWAKIIRNPKTDDMMKSVLQNYIADCLNQIEEYKKEIKTIKNELVP